MAALVGGARAVRDGLRRVPGPADWAHAAALLVGFLAVAAFVGLRTGLLAFRPPARFDRVTLGVVAWLLVEPGIVEEVFWRGLLLPPPEAFRAPRRGRALAIACVAWLLFVAIHPLHGALDPRLLPTFGRPDFLLLAGLLGMACTIAYLRTRSLWPAIAIHWLAVVAWIVLFGGGGRIGIPLTAR